MRTTLKDVAMASGLSMTTVSLVLNNKPNRIPPKTRDLIVRTAKKLNYRPNSIAVSMVTKKTHTIGLILPDISNLYFSSLAKTIEERFHQYGYNVFYGNTNGRPELDFEYLNLFIDRGVDAIIMTTSAYHDKRDNEILKQIYAANHIPIMMVDRGMNSSYFLSVEVDQELGGFLATDYLIRMGHRRIACLTGPKSLKISTDRLQGYRDALQKASIPFDPALVLEGNFGVESGAKALSYFLGQNATAVFCMNDMMAIGIYRESRRYNICIPNNLSVIGFDDIFIDEFLEPPLSTISQPIDEIGQYTVDKMMAVLSGKDDSPKAKLFKPVLKIRGSTAKNEKMTVKKELK
ncbi:MAG TPA: LacI family transcriptional regulator [Ruminococcaceae bacterium]|jgi:LacI family transcriptional regulator|nr:LacI family transcriptional regulator [Oscillospiraceae bacterium]HCM22778.1 LacI family transcriptional regulator [Oscillospiraceae bacterium]